MRLDGSVVSTHSESLKHKEKPRCVRLRDVLGYYTGKYDVIGIAMEEPYGAHKASLKVLYKVFGVAEFLCELWGIPYHQAHTMTVKKFATGKGNAKKADMIAAALKQWPELPADISDDEADALWVAEHYRVMAKESPAE